LELELGQFSQGSMSIQEFYSSFVNLWAEYTDILYASVPPEGLIAIQSVHETSKRCCYPIFDPCFDKFSKKSKNSEKH